MNINQVILTYLEVHKEATGYNIAKYLSDKTGNSHQQVYRNLGNLETQGYVVHRVVPQEGKPDRKVYKLTDVGKSVDKVGDGEPSDFTKTKLSYVLACLDLTHPNEDFHGRYIKAMQDAEEAFLDQLA